jgi:DNA/RNA-binding domain of Phe-tRNA-synthetase-like protein
MKITIDPALKKKCPGAALACITARVQIAESPEGLLAELNLRAGEIQRLPFPRGVLASPQIEATRRAYKALGKDPARYRGSAEALLRRVVAGKDLPQVNNVVDVINLVSIESRLSVGLYDLAHVAGEIVFRPGRAEESYKGIGKYDLNLDGLPVFSDAAGPHGSPTSDSERTMVTNETTHVLAVIISFASSENLQRWSQRLAALLQQYAKATEIETALVS